MISDPVAVLVVLAAVVYLAVHLEERFRFFRSLGSAVVGILLAMVLSNTGVIPGASPTYEFLMGPAVSVGIALLLFSVDVRTVFSAGPRMLAAFGIGALATAVGAAVGAFAWAGSVGDETWKLAGMFAGTYIGGGLNFAALAQALGINSDLFTAGTAADVIVTAFWMAACLSAPLLFRANGPASRAETPPEAPEAAADDDGPPTLERTLYASRRPLHLTDVAALVALAIGALALSQWIGEWLPAVPSVLWLTTISLALAQVQGIRRIAGSAVLGNYLILLFLSSNGARSVVANIIDVGPAVFWYAVTTVVIHGALIFGIGRVVGLDAGTLAVASQANVGGPASAMAMASARGYGDKLLPGVAVGLLGYAVGNYAGYLVAMVMRGVMGG